MSAVDSAPDDVRAIEAAAAPTRFARGWHCLGLSEKYRDGKPHSVRAFGQKLVVFQAGDGTLSVLDAYCRHMGGDLSQGTVKGDEVACPFHDWRWGGDGRCKQIPYSKRVPLRARTASWPTLDQDGMLFVWNDPEGSPPPADVVIPRIEGATSDEWTDWLWYETTIDANCREVVDNVVDMAHFFYVHYSFPTFFKNVFEGHTATQHMRATGRPDARPQEQGDKPKTTGSNSLAAYHGPSFMIDDLTYHYDTGDQQSVLINCHYPVDANRFVLQYGIIVRRSPSMTASAADELAAGMAQFIKLGFEQDIQIWQNKARIDNPLLCEEDGPVYQLRRWYEQFYVDVADVKPEMTDRFEFELDTTRPVEAWQKEVEANLARKAAAAPAEGPAGLMRVDNRLADGVPMRPLACDRCAAQVLVRKSSRQQTSVQWNSGATALCAEREGAGPAFEGCGSLRDTIREATLRGTIELADGGGGETGGPGRQLT